MPEGPKPRPRRVDSSPPEAEATLNERQLGPSLQIGGEGRLRLRVGFGFFVITGAPGIAGGAPRMALYATVALLAVLAHELGHAACGILWGSQATIVVHVLGGRTTLEPRLSRSREIVATLTGPCISILIALGLAALRSRYPEQHWLTVALWVNLGWGLVNLLPMLPFDGGRALLNLLGVERRSSALIISGSFALALSVEGLFVLRNAALLFVFGPAAFASFMAWTRQRRMNAELELGLPEQMERARSLLASGESERSRRLALLLTQRARINATANAAWEIVAWSELQLGRTAEAFEAVGRVRPASDVDPFCLAAVEAARGQPRRAVKILEAARTAQTLCPDAIKLLIDLHARLGSLDRACVVASAEMTALEPPDTRRVIEAAFEAQEFAQASKLAGELFALNGCPDDAVSQAYGLARLGDRTRAQRIFRELATPPPDWQMHRKTRARLRDLATRPDASDILGPALSRLVLTDDSSRT
jgi:hypothetical protein